jgi:hypothetical protein
MSTRTPRQGHQHLGERRPVGLQGLATVLHHQQGFGRDQQEEGLQEEGLQEEGLQEEPPAAAPLLALQPPSPQTPMTPLASTSNCRLTPSLTTPSGHQPRCSRPLQPPPGLRHLPLAEPS